MNEPKVCMSRIVVSTRSAAIGLAPLADYDARIRFGAALFDEAGRRGGG